MKRFIFAMFLACALSFSGCDVLYEVAKDATGSSLAPSLTEMTGGLKEALVKGTASAVSGLSKSGGFLNDPLVKIPFPQEAQFAVNTLKDLGLGSLVTQMEKLLNDGAEQGAKAALPIFRSAIKEMTFADAKNILLGGNNAATDYFEAKTRAKLAAEFSPFIKGSLDRVDATNVWGKITNTYNSIPLTNKKIETDLVKYTTDKALDGLFLKVASEEKLIRTNPVKRSTDLLKKVFEYAASQK